MRIRICNIPFVLRQDRALLTAVCLAAQFTRLIQISSFLDYSLGFSSNVTNVYEAFEPDELCQYSAAAGSCATSSAVYCCVNPYFEEDGSSGKRTGQYCLVESTRYGVYSPVLRGYSFDISINATVGNSSDNIVLTTKTPTARSASYSIQGFFSADAYQALPSRLLFSSPPVPGTAVNQSDWFVMEDYYLATFPIGITGSAWMSSVQSNGEYCSRFRRAITPTDPTDPTDQFKPFKNDIRSRVAFDPDYATAEIVSERFARISGSTAASAYSTLISDGCASIRCNLRTSDPQMRIRASKQPETFLSMTIFL